MSPRQGHGSMWILLDRSIVLMYIGCRSDVRELHYFCYSYPKYEGQISFSQRFLDGAPLGVSELLKISAVIKYLTPTVIQKVNLWYE